VAAVAVVVAVVIAVVSVAEVVVRGVPVEREYV
jgi:hypothetical protein